MAKGTTRLQEKRKATEAPQIGVPVPLTLTPGLTGRDALIYCLNRSLPYLRFRQ